ncbi:hypothetical protein [uncultured Hyphomicrobium sp.]|uniref:hypothetical protein n=1 Tax=uncultured Hyphomicrobium sp. TaxID=194373 RepID=UPI0025F1C2F8|nr:hypothetical protein [uncultured Hyphomicrobium sp.]
MRLRMMLIALFPVLLFAAGTAPAAAADVRKKSYAESERKVEHREQARRAHATKRERLRQRRYAKRYYYYPFTSYWGPFAGPPGLF